MRPSKAAEPTSSVFTYAVTLTPAEPHLFDLAFTAITQPCPWPKAYGGDLVAQAAVAAMRSVTEDRTLHSMHSYFMRPADIGAELRYEVEALRDGRGYSTRQIRAYQDDRVVYVCLANFATGEPSGCFAQPSPIGLPVPTRQLSSESYLAGRTGGTMTEASNEYWSRGRGFDMRHVPGPLYLTVEGAQVPHQAVWIRPFDALRPVPGLTDAQLRLAALAYVCDYTILEPILRTLGLAWAQPGLVTASLDHAMWFHRAPRIEGWLLYAQEALAAEHGRGVAAGRFFDSDGRHVASVVQEGMIRQPPATLDSDSPHVRDAVEP